WHLSGQEAQDFTPFCIDAEETWRAIEPARLEMLQQRMHTGAIAANRAPHRLAHTHDTGRHAATRERDFGLAHCAATGLPTHSCQTSLRAATNASATPSIVAPGSLSFCSNAFI